MVDYDNEFIRHIFKTRWCKKCFFLGNDKEEYPCRDCELEPSNYIPKEYKLTEDD